MTLGLLTTYSILIGIVLDFILGDPSGWYHPVRLIGNLIYFLEQKIRKVFNKTSIMELMGGGVLVVAVTVITGAVVYLILFIAYRINGYVYLAVASIMNYYLMATKCLKVETMKVYKALVAGDINGARTNISMLVGRDVDRLDEAGIARAAVETAAENLSDGCIAPLFYMFIGGPVFGFIYKSINTMDSMVGYKNDKYLYFGRAAAKLDDLVNYIPARIAAVFMIISAFICGCDGKNAIKIFKRDRYKSTSPNSGQTESVAAGALNVRLLGPTWYFGKLHNKDYVGDDNKKIESTDIKRVNKMNYATVIILTIIFVAIRLAALGQSFNIIQLFIM